jgi:hypothetical protein
VNLPRKKTRELGGKRKKQQKTTERSDEKRNAAMAGGRRRMGKAKAAAKLKRWGDEGRERRK